MGENLVDLSGSMSNGWRPPGHPNWRPVTSRVPPGSCPGIYPVQYLYQWPEGGDRVHPHQDWGHHQNRDCNWYNQWKGCYSEASRQATGMGHQEPHGIQQWQMRTPAPGINSWFVPLQAVGWMAEQQLSWEKPRELPGESPEQAGLIPELALLRAGSWTRDLLRTLPTWVTLQFWDQVALNKVLMTPISVLICAS